VLGYPVGVYFKTFKRRDINGLLEGLSLGKISPLLKDLLLSSGVIEEQKEITVSEIGYQFLLKDIEAQLWTLLQAYIINQGVNKIEMMGLLFQFSFLSVGKGYPITSLTKPQQQMIKDWTTFGLVFIPEDKKSSMFYPTRVAINLTNNITKDEQDKGFIVTETNFHIYAYTSCHIKLALLSLFASLLYELPNFTTGMISRESVYRAFKCGISAEQIVNFLHKNAHPKLKEHSPVLPKALVTQIQLWEDERRRIHFDKGVLYTSFKSKDIFLKTEEYAKKIGALIWSNKEKQHLFCKGEAHDQIKKIVQQNN